MSTREKLLEQWVNNPPKIARKHEVVAVLEWFSPGETSERVKGVLGADALGVITIPCSAASRPRASTATTWR